MAVSRSSGRVERHSPHLPTLTLTLSPWERGVLPQVITAQGPGGPVAAHAHVEGGRVVVVLAEAVTLARNQTLQIVYSRNDYTRS